MMNSRVEHAMMITIVIESMLLLLQLLLRGVQRSLLLFRLHCISIYSGELEQVVLEALVFLRQLIMIIV